jgi:hypothetical protein
MICVSSPSQDQHLLTELMMEKHLAGSQHLLLNLYKVLMLKQVAADMRKHCEQEWHIQDLSIKLQEVCQRKCNTDTMT